MLQDGSIVHFKAKVTTPFRKLMTAYCDRQSVAAESVVFLFEGERLRGEQTPQEVRLLMHQLQQEHSLHNSVMVSSAG